jgi:hypothetical protein
MVVTHGRNPAIVVADFTQAIGKIATLVHMLRR